MDEQLKAHLEFFEELGIEGVRLEPEWHARREPTEPAPSESIESTEPRGPRIALRAIYDDLGVDCSRCSRKG